jgi:imidazolonepropionase-like amidohydrolase
MEDVMHRCLPVLAFPLLLATLAFPLLLATLAFPLLLAAPGAARAAAAPAAAAPASFAITHVRVFDGQRVIPDATVVVRGRTIAAVGPKVKVPAGAAIVDGRGATLLPGLIDAHTHTWGNALERALVFGVTTELDMFTDPGFAAAMRKQQVSGDAPGRADLRSAGYLATVPGGHGTEYGMPVPTLTTPAEAQAWVDARIAEGSDYIKIISEDGSAYGGHIPTLDRATIAALVTAAHARAKLAVVHVSTLASAEEALEAGADGLAHAFVEAAPPSFVELAVRHKAFVIPTLTVLESTTGVASGRSLVDDPRLAPYLNFAEIENLDKSFPRRGEPRFDDALATVRALFAARVPIVAGSDAPNPGTTHGASIHRELELLVSAGLTPAQALAAATATPAKVFGLADRGRIAKGLRADLLLVDGDPTRDVTATRAIRHVWKAGQEVARPTAPPRAAAAAAGETKEIPDSGEVSDFEGGDAATSWGAAWVASTDQMAGGKSTVDVTVADAGAGNSKRSLAVAGEVRPGFAYPWAGAMLPLGGAAMPAVDLSRFVGVSFVAKGEGGSYRLLAFAKHLGRIPASKAFTAGSEWERVTVSFSELGLDGTDLQAFFIGGGPEPGAFRLQVDDVHLVGTDVSKEPPARP